MRRSCVILLGLVCLVFSGVAAASATTYNYTELLPASGAGNDPWGFSVAHVGSATEVVGASFTHAWTPTVRINGVASSLLPNCRGPWRGPTIAAHAINDNGDIAGQTHVSSVQRAFFIHSGSGTILPTLGGSTGGSSAWGVNDSGTVVGYSAAADGNVHAFVWSQSTGIVDLGTSGQMSFATAISPDGNTIVGGIAARPSPVTSINKVSWRFRPSPDRHGQ